MKTPQALLMVLIFLVAKSWGTALETVAVPKGQLNQFWLTPVSNKSEKKVRPKKVSVPSIQAMKYAVTVEQFAEFLAANPSWQKQNISTIYSDQSYLESWAVQMNHPKSPVTYVSWFAARAFCESYGMRLPTVNEWEYMAAASGTKRDANKDEIFLRRILDWYGEPRTNEMKPVGSIYRNYYGLWDMHGLIWEWVEDFNTVFVTGESREDTSFNKNMFCGAGAMSGADKENYASFMRFAFRSSLKGRSSAWNLGFRCVK